MFSITIKFEQPGLEPVILKGIEPGQNLLEICLKNNIALHHACGGVCSCSSCHVYIMRGKEHLEEQSKKEKDFIARTANPHVNSRLGCQSLLVGNKGEVEIKIPDQSFLFISAGKTGQ